MTEAVFWFFAAAAVLTAAGCILQRNPVVAALLLVTTMFSLAAIFVLLNAQFVAAMQVLVYAGAIMVLFLFVIMLLNLGRDPTDRRLALPMGATVVVAGLLAAELLVLGRYTPDRLAREAMGAALPAPAPAAATGNVVQDVALPLFTTYLIPFELTALLLLAAVVGAVVLAKRKL